MSPSFSGLIGIFFCALTHSKSMSPIDSLWDFNDPESSEQRFLAALTSEEDLGLRAELLTQVARARGLQRRFDEAHETLDEALAAIEPGTRAEVRYMLERGRVINSSGGRIASRQVFHQALEAATAISEDGLAVDAAHMIAIVEDGDKSLEWNLRAIQLAEASDKPDARKWLASLYNNTAWSLFDLGRLQEAYEAFVKARAQREANGQLEQERIARWCIARCLREMGHQDKATKMQIQLLEEDPDSGFVHEELAELYASEGETKASAAHAKKALEKLEADVWFSESNPERLERLRFLIAEQR